MSSPGRLVVWAVLLCLSVAGRAGAGETEAEDATKSGAAALRKGDAAAAVAWFRTALEQMPEYLPARSALGDALLGGGDERGGLEALRKVVRDAAALASVPRKWQEAVQHARRRLAEVDVRGKELDAILDGHVRSVLSLAEKMKGRDPDLVERALKVALTLRPDDDRAIALRDALSSRGARREAMFDGKQIEDWDGGRGQWWSVVDGVIVADAGKDVATFVRTQKQVEGDFDVIVEARFLEAQGDAPLFALMGAWVGEYDHSRFGVFDDAVFWSEEHAKGDHAQVYSGEVRNLSPALDPKAWNTYELRYRAKEIRAAVNGREVAKIPRPEHRAGGFVGLLVQECRVEFRRVDVLHR